MVEQPAACAGSGRKHDNPKGKSKVNSQTGSRRHLHNGHVNTKAIALNQATSLLRPASLRRSNRLKRKAAQKAIQSLKMLLARLTKGDAWQCSKNG